jgi:hypothetical protein
VTALDCGGVVPVTVAVKFAIPPGLTLTADGDTDTAITGVDLTVTVATSLADGFATLLAATWKVPGCAGAVYVPETSTVPPPLSCTDHVTLGVVPPLTVAVNTTTPSTPTVAWWGVTATVTELPPGMTLGLQPSARAAAVAANPKKRRVTARIRCVPSIPGLENNRAGKS